MDERDDVPYWGPGVPRIPISDRYNEEINPGPCLFILFWSAKGGNEHSSNCAYRDELKVIIVCPCNTVIPKTYTFSNKAKHTIQ
jgi:hypothetical protein